MPRLYSVLKKNTQLKVNLETVFKNKTKETFTELGMSSYVNNHLQSYGGGGKNQFNFQFSLPALIDKENVSLEIALIGTWQTSSLDSDCQL